MPRLGLPGEEEEEELATPSSKPGTPILEQRGHHGQHGGVRASLGQGRKGTESSTRPDPPKQRGPLIPIEPPRRAQMCKDQTNNVSDRGPKLIPAPTQEEPSPAPAPEAPTLPSGVPSC